MATCAARENISESIASSAPMMSRKKHGVYQSPSSLEIEGAYQYISGCIIYNSNRSPGSGLGLGWRLLYHFLSGRYVLLYKLILVPS